ncbi:MAG: FAD-binding protein, partial [Planctomycetes bacterium]|nr:FAD-binding protein [Planctomycetota bacterium]
MHLPPPAVPSRWTDVPPASLPVERVPVLILGAGVAGLRAALEACRMQRVLVLTKGPPSDSNTAHAQGGIAVAWSDDDTPLSHGADTIEVGQGLCDPRAVSILAGEAAGRFRELLDWGARFDKDGLHLALGREGGHSAARILHARGDATGAEVMRTLLERASHEPSIELRAGLYAVDLLVDGGRCVGAVVHDGVGLRTILAGAVVLATGGAGHLFRETTNPPGATGDGVACAYRAGAVVRDLEFMQFHPTTLYVAGASRSLISEATRGEG